MWSGGKKDVDELMQRMGRERVVDIVHALIDWGGSEIQPYAAGSKIGK